MGPWGTPAFIFFHSEFDPFKTTRWDRPERYLSNHTNRLPDIPYCFSLNNNPLCNTRSKAFTNVKEYNSDFFPTD